jgi:hypothetical protein
MQQLAAGRVQVPKDEAALPSRDKVKRVLKWQEGPKPFISPTFRPYNLREKDSSAHWVDERHYLGPVQAGLPGEVCEGGKQIQQEVAVDIQKQK